MTFKNTDSLLEKRVENGEISEEKVDNIFELERTLKEPLKTTLSYTRDLAAALDIYGLKEKYALFGGYAVLAHLVDEYGDNFTKAWRGSEDIDIIGGVDILNSIRSNYLIHDDNPSQNIKDKRTLKISNEYGPEKSCKVDYVDREFDGKSVEEVDVLGVPLRVLPPVELLKSKIGFYESDRKQIEDIVSLLDICERRNIGVGEISKPMSSTEKSLLDKFLKELRSQKDRRIAIYPSDDYLKQLKKRVNMFK